MLSFLKEKIKNFKGDKRILVIVLLGVTGVIFLSLSEIIPNTDGTDKLESDEAQSVSEYEISLEERLSDLLESIDGAGKVRVMITLDCGDESVYATESKSSDSSTEKNYVIVDSNGDDEGLLLKVSKPQVRGVAVVCEGADLPQVRQEITGAITAVLGVSTNRVNIAKMKTYNGGKDYDN